MMFKIFYFFFSLDELRIRNLYRWFFRKDEKDKKDKKKLFDKFVLLEL